MFAMFASPAAADPVRPVTDRLGWQVDFDALVQVDAVPFSQESQDDLDPGTRAPLNEETITLRRALLRAQAHRDNVFAVIELESTDTAGPTTRLLGSVIGWNILPGDHGAPPLLTVVGGLLLVPFGTEIPTNLRDKPFLEVPTWANALMPGNYDGGVEVRGAFDLLRYAVAITDGAPSGDAQWKGRDPTSDYDFVGRIGASIDGQHFTGRPHLDVGVSFLTGTGLHPGIAPTKGQVVWEDTNGDGIVQESELMGIPDNPGEPSQKFHRDALGADAMASWCLEGAGKGVAFFEGVIGKNFDRGVVDADPITASRDIRELGFSAGVVQDASKWAQVGVRYDRYNADRDAAEQQGLSFVQTKQIFSTTSFLAVFRWTTARVIVQYDHVENPFGRADNGAPVTRRADKLTLRAQVMF